MASTIQGSDVEKTSTTQNNPNSVMGGNAQPQSTPKTQVQTPQNAPQSPQTGSSSPSIGQFNQANSQTPKPRQQGTGFTNLNRVINANQNNRLGSTIAGGINQNVQNVRTSVTNAQNQFQTQAQQGALGGADQVQARQDFLNRAQQGEVNNQDIQNAQRYLSGQYTGPQGLQNADALSAQAQSAQELAQQAGTTGGRASLLQKFAGGNQYTQGQQNLDNLILGATGGNQLNQAKRAGSGLLQNVQNTAQGAQGQANALAQQSQAFGEGTKNLINQQQQGVNSAVNANLTAAQKAEQDRQSNLSNVQNLLGAGYNNNDYDSTIKGIQAAQQAGLFTPEQAKQATEQANFTKNVSSNPNDFFRGLGIGDIGLGGATLDNQANYNTLQNITNSSAGKVGGFSNQLLQNLSGTNAQNLTAEGITDAQQRAQLNALSKLTGQNTAIDPNSPIYKAGTNTLNTEKALGNYQGSTGQLEDSFNKLLAQKYNNPADIEQVKRMAGWNY